jgi:hypothetical protein
VNRDKIEVFWNWFRENHQNYSNFNEIYSSYPKESTRLLDVITKELKEFSEGLFFEISADKERKELIITAQGNREYFVDALELVEYAPTIEDWKFIALKPAIGLDFNFKMGEVTINPSEITFMPLEAPEYPHDIAIRLYHKDYTPKEGATRNAVIIGLYSALNMLLGEKESSLIFQYIDFDDMPHPKEQSFPFSGLKDYIEYKKGERPHSGLEFPKEDVAIMEGKIDTLPSLLILNKSLDYYEFTQKFPYLLQLTLTIKNVTENGLPQGNIDELYLIEDIIYQEIFKEKKGHFIATQTHNGKRDLFYYADSKESIDKALSMLTLEYESCEVHYSIDYDPFWIRTNKFRA